MIELRSDVPAPTGFHGATPDAVDQLVAVESAPGGARAPVAVLVLNRERPTANVSRVWIEPTARGRVERDIVTAAVEHFRARGIAVLGIDVSADQQELHEVLRHAPITDVSMTKQVSDPLPELPPGFGSRPMTPAEYDRWTGQQVEAYAQDNLPRLGGDLELAREHAAASIARLLPAGSDTPDTDLLTLTMDDEPVGLLWLRHRWRSTHAGQPADQSFIFDVEISAARRGQGLGRAALAVAERATRAAGDGHLGLHVFGENVVARGLYASYGFSAVETTYDALQA